MDKRLTHRTTLALLFVSILFATTASAETKIYKGYVLTISGEKLIGEIEMLSPTLNEVKVKFIGQGNTKQLFKAKEVKEYAFVVKKWNKEEKAYNEQWITYVQKEVERAPIAFGSTSVLIEREIEGTINLYNHYIEQNGNTQEPFAHVIYLEKEINNLVSVTKENYKPILKKMMADNPNLVAKIGTKEHTFPKLIDVLIMYNQEQSKNGDAFFKSASKD